MTGIVISIDVVCRLPKKEPHASKIILSHLEKMNKSQKKFSIENKHM